MRFLHNEVSSEAIRGYVRLGTQIEQVWQQLDDKLTELTLQGMTPWDAYSTMGYALVFVRSCRLHVVLVQKLIEEADPTNSGYIPRPTYDQAHALGELFEPYLEEAIRLLDSRYVTRLRIPLQLRRVRHEGQYSSAHLLGVMAAARETREWAAGLLAQYTLAIEAPKLPIPQPITAHLEAIKNQLTLGDFHLESALHLIGDIRTGKQVAEAIGAQGEDLLWEAMEGFHQISQLVAYPGARTQPAPAAPAVPTAPPPSQPPSVFVPPAPPVNTSARASAHVSDLLGQLNQAHPAGKPTPSSSGAPDLLKDLQMSAPPGAATQPSPDASTLLQQLQQPSPPAALPADTSQGSKHRAPQESATTEKKVADLLSDIGGEHSSQK